MIAKQENSVVLMIPFMEGNLYQNLNQESTVNIKENSPFS